MSVFRHDTRRKPSGLTTRIEAISPTEIFKVINKPYQLQTNHTTKSSLQITYESVAIFHECVRYTTKYNVLSTFGHCLHPLLQRSQQGLCADKRGNKISKEKFYRKLLSDNYLLTYCRTYLSMLLRHVYAAVAAVNKYHFSHV